MCPVFTQKVAIYDVPVAPFSVYKAALKGMEKNCVLTAIWHMNTGVIAMAVVYALA